MNSLKMLCVLACGALVQTSPGRAEGTFDMPAGAHFNQQKLAKVTEFFRNEVATGKIAGANVLIQQHGSRSIMKLSACRTWCPKRRSPTRPSSACLR